MRGEFISEAPFYFFGVQIGEGQHKLASRVSVKRPSVAERPRSSFER
jgi:hypothetical protein